MIGIKVATGDTQFAFGHKKRDEGATESQKKRKMGRLTHELGGCQECGAQSDATAQTEAVPVNCSISSECGKDWGFVGQLSGGTTGEEGHSWNMCGLEELP